MPPFLVAVVCIALTALAIVLVVAMIEDYCCQVAANVGDIATTLSLEPC